MNKQVKLPQGFFLGAAASAWQTEGWKGKKDGQDSYMDAWYKKTGMCGMRGTALPLPLTLWNGIGKTLDI